MAAPFLDCLDALIERAGVPKLLVDLGSTDLQLLVVSAVLGTRTDDKQALLHQTIESCAAVHPTFSDSKEDLRCLLHLRAIELLGQTIAEDGSGRRAALPEAPLSALVAQVCLPVLRLPEVVGVSAWLRQAVIAAVPVLTRLAPTQWAADLGLLMLEDLRYYAVAGAQDLPSTSAMAFSALCDLVAGMLPVVPASDASWVAWTENVRRAAFALLCSHVPLYRALICTHVVALFMNPPADAAALCALVPSSQDALAATIADMAREKLSDSYAVLCQFLGSLPTMHRSPLLWQLLYDGMVDPEADPVMAKRSVHLMNSALGAVLEDQVSDATTFRTLWNNFKIIYECLSGFGAHLVEQAWVKLTDLIIAATTPVPSSPDAAPVQPSITELRPTCAGTLFPFAWVALLIRRGFNHSNVSVRRTSFRSFISWPQALECPVPFIAGSLFQFTHGPSMFSAYKQETLTEFQQFLTNYCNHIASPAARAQAASDIAAGAAQFATSKYILLCVIRGLACASAAPVLSDPLCTSLVQLCDKLHQTCRMLTGFSREVLAILVHFGDATTMSVPALTGLLKWLMESGMPNASQEHADFQVWLQPWLLTTMRDFVHASCTGTPDTFVPDVATGAGYLLSHMQPLAPLVDVLTPVWHVLRAVHDHPYLNDNARRNAFELFAGVGEHAGDECRASLRPALEPCLDSVTAYLSTLIRTIVYAPTSVPVADRLPMDLCVGVLRQCVRIGGADSLAGRTAFALFQDLATALTNAAPSVAHLSPSHFQVTRTVIMHVLSAIIELVIAPIAAAGRDSLAAFPMATLLPIATSAVQRPAGAVDPALSAADDSPCYAKENSTFSSGSSYVSWSQLHALHEYFKWQALAGVVTALGPLMEPSLAEAIGNAAIDASSACTLNGLGALLICLRAVVQTLATAAPEEHAELIARLVRSGWNAFLDGERVRADAAQCLAALLTTPALFVPPAPVLPAVLPVHAAMVNHFSSKERPALVLQMYTSCLCAALAGPGVLETIPDALVDIIVQLLVYRDVVQPGDDPDIEDINQVTAIMSTVNRVMTAAEISRLVDHNRPAPRSLSVVRVQLLLFLNQFGDAETHRPTLGRILHRLLDIQLDRRNACSNPYDELHGVKIRGTQALCFMSKFVTAPDAPLMFEKAVRLLNSILFNSVREYTELFASHVGIQHATLVAGKYLIPYLGQFNMPNQASISAILVTSDTMLELSRRVVAAGAAADAAIIDLCADLCFAIVPWFSCVNGVLRSTSQYVVNEMLAIPPVRAKLFENRTMGQMMKFMTGNRKINRSNRKLTELFQRRNIAERTSLMSLLTSELSNIGDFIPKSGFDEISDVFQLSQIMLHAMDPNVCLRDRIVDARLIFLTEDPFNPEVVDEEDSVLKARAAQLDIPIEDAPEPTAAAGDEPQVMEAPVMVDAAAIADPVSATFNFQRKILPWSTIMIGSVGRSTAAVAAKGELQGVTSTTDATGRPCQPLIVVASFVDRVPNLGGLARTCEIFGARTLVVADLAVKNDGEFKAVSVTAGDWLHMTQVPPDDVLAYIREQRAAGYTIVGLEQATSSRPLDSVELPDKVCLVLGREKEGIPVDIIQELDIIVEIPQFGLLRSLNVHVSGALLVWEYTKQRVSRSRKTFRGIV